MGHSEKSCPTDLLYITAMTKIFTFAFIKYSLYSINIFILFNFLEFDVNVLYNFVEFRRCTPFTLFTPYLISLHAK